MSDQDIKALIDKRATIWGTITELRSRIASPDGTNPDSAAEDRANFDKATADIVAIGEDIDRLTRAAKLSEVDYSKVIDTTTDEGKRSAEVVSEGGDTAAEYRAAFDMYCRYGNQELTREQAKLLREHRISDLEVRAQGIGTNTAGGYTVPPLFRDVLIERLKYFSGMRQNASHIDTNQGGPLPWMTNDDTTNVGAILGENTQVTETDLTFGTATFDVFMYTSGSVLVSFQLLQDSALDLDAFLPRKLGERIGRIQNTHFTVGTGSGQPQGIVTGGTSVALATGNVTSYTYASLIAASHTRLDPAYLGGQNLKWMGSQAAIAAFLTLSDSQNRPLWQPSLVVGAPDTLLGYGIVMNNDMPVPAANAKSLLFGDIAAAYIIRDVMGLNVIRLTERYADFGQVGFIGWMRSGGIVQNTNAYAIIANSAT